MSWRKLKPLREKNVSDGTIPIFYSRLVNFMIFLHDNHPATLKVTGSREMKAQDKIDKARTYFTSNGRRKRKSEVKIQADTAQRLHLCTYCKDYLSVTRVTQKFEGNGNANVYFIDEIYSQLIRNWLVGDVSLNIPPFSKLSTVHIRHTKNALKKWNSIEVLMAYIEKVGRRVNLWINRSSNWTYSHYNTLWSCIENDYVMNLFAKESKKKK